MAIDLVLDGAETAAQPTALAPEVTTESVLAEVEQLTPEEQKQIEQFAGKIDIHKSEIVMNYGATIQKQSASIATNLASAEMLIMGLQRGDLDWREMLRSKTRF